MSNAKITQLRGNFGALNATIGPFSMFNGAPSLIADYTTGALVGTVVLEVRPAGGGANDWVPVAAGLTAQGIINPGIIWGDYEVRGRCSAYTSGTGPGTLSVAA